MTQNLNAAPVRLAAIAALVLALPLVTGCGTMPTSPAPASLSPRLEATSGRSTLEDSNPGSETGGAQAMDPGAIGGVSANTPGSGSTGGPATGGSGFDPGSPTGEPIEMLDPDLPGGDRVGHAKHRGHAYGHGHGNGNGHG
jgi:hypothetical protein